VRDKIVELYGKLPRIELFARQQVKGWDCLGNGIDGKDIRNSLSQMVTDFNVKSDIRKVA